MIKFFRIIRQKLLSQGKLSKYLIYAFGEILLVVIGILIALNVNNRNEQKRMAVLEVKYLTEIQNNLKADQADVDFNINFNKSKLNSNQQVLAYLNGKVNHSDSLAFHFSNLMFNTRTLVNPSGYESLKSKGLEIISNDLLRIQITTLYEFDIQNLVDFEAKDDHPFQYAQFIPAVFQALDIQFTSGDSQFPNGKAQPINQRDITRNTVLKNAISTNILLREVMLGGYIALKADMMSTIDEIKIELKSFQQ